MKQTISRLIHEIKMKKSHKTNCSETCEAKNSRQGGKNKIKKQMLVFSHLWFIIFFTQNSTWSICFHTEPFLYCSYNGCKFLSTPWFVYNVKEFSICLKDSAHLSHWTFWKSRMGYIGNICHDHNYYGMTEHPSSLEGGDRFKMLSWTIMYYSAEKLFFELIASVVTSSSTERVTKTWSTPTFFMFANHKKCYICFWQNLQPSDTLCSLHLNLL